MWVSLEAVLLWFYYDEMEYQSFYFKKIEKYGSITEVYGELLYYNSRHIIFKWKMVSVKEC